MLRGRRLHPRQFLEFSCQVLHDADHALQDHELAPLMHFVLFYAES
jgi:hypothetical protein